MGNMFTTDDYNITAIRARFPSLTIKDNNINRIYLDNPGGTQVCKTSLDKIQDYLINNNANRGGFFRTSIDTESILLEARRAMSDFLHADSEREIVFGQNMTSLTFAIARSLAKWIQTEHEIVVTRLDHDGNISPWLQLADETGAKIRWIDFNPKDCTLDLDDFEKTITDKTKLVAIGYASNSVGTINPIKKIASMAHSVGALVFVDAVQYAPHAPIDVQELDADFLVCSPYKFFGPHQGVLWGKYELLDRLPPYKVRPAKNHPPHKFETGTQSHEGQAGTLGALEHIEWIGRQFGHRHASQFPKLTNRCLHMHCGMAAIKTYEQKLSTHLIEGLQKISEVRIYGITEIQQLDKRVPTVSFTLKGYDPRHIAQIMGDKNIFVWDGHNYAIETMSQLGLEKTGGMIRVGPAHYNTIEELDQLLEVLTESVVKH